jgi:hypothetical protein
MRVAMIGTGYVGLVRRAMAQPVVTDLRNVCQPDDMAAHGSVYQGLGKGKVQPGRDSSRKPLSPALPRRHDMTAADIASVEPTS